MTADQLDALLEAIAHAERVLILTHNDPDPDAIGSAVALRHLLLNQKNRRGKDRLPGPYWSSRK